MILAQYYGITAEPEAPLASGGVRIRDLAQRLARIPAQVSAWSFYSLAQRSVLLADAVAKAEGPLAAVYALLHAAPEAFIGITGDMAPKDAELWLHTASRIAESVHTSTDLDWPPPQTTAKAIAAAYRRLSLSELIILFIPDEAARKKEIARLRRAGVTPLNPAFRPWPQNKGEDFFYAAWKKYAAAAALAPTAAWEYLQ